jgi:hypothetical protein
LFKGEKKMKMWLESCKARCKAVVTRCLVVALVAVVVIGSVATFNFTKSANAAVAAPAAAPLDDNSVGALLTLDRAMETLAARVTPAVVNVTVASKANAQQSRGGESPTCSNFLARAILSAVNSVFRRSLRTGWNMAWAAA